MTLSVASAGNKPAPGNPCKLVGMEDEERDGKIRKFQCCPVSNDDDDDDDHDEL